MTQLEKLDRAVGIAIEAQMAEDDNAGPDLAKAARIALLSHLAATGWQVVPKVEAEGMRVVGRDARWQNAVRSADNVGEIFSAMIAAAPDLFAETDDGK